MDFDSIEQMYAELEKQVKTALIIEAQKIKLAIEEYIANEIYGSYPNPSFYQRTGELLNSVEVSPVTNSNGEYIIEIYIKPDEHSASNWIGSNRTLPEIMNWFSSGEAYARNGAKLDAMGITYDDIVESGKCFSNLLDYLRRRGFDI
jgi:hypothetical protein